MKKDTIEIFRARKCISGYAWLPYSTPKEIGENSILNKLCEWSKGKNVTIYSHYVEKREENFKNYKKKYEFRDPNCPPLDIPYCDWVYYLDIWYQEK